MIQILFAFLAGILTVGAPCILPLLPVLMGTSVGQTGKTRPLYIVAGFVLTFAVLGVSLSFLTSRLGIDPNVLRNIAISLLAVFGLLLVWPKPFELLTMHINGFINRAYQLGTAQTGNRGAFVLGLTLGVVWTPCAGPVLGAILTLIAAQQDLARSLTLLVAYSLGAGVPMLVIAYGSQWITTKVRLLSRYTARLQQIFGIIIILLAIAMYYQADVQLQTRLANYFPSINLESKLTQTNINMAQTEFENLGPAPEFVGIENWLNSDPLTMKSLRGKVVLVDFWTFSCINCIRTMPYVTKWYDTYKDAGFVVVGVHTPEFEFEKNKNNVADAINRFKIHYPVAQDNDYATWNNYSNQYWPAEYLIDQKGRIVYTHFGEGNYDRTENTIRTLLGLEGEMGANPSYDLSEVGSPEMYFGLNRLKYLTADQTASDQEKDYVLPDQLVLNTFALGGKWKFTPEAAELEKAGGRVRLKFHSAKLHIVAESDHPQTISVSIDGKPQAEVSIGDSELYTLFESTEYNDHVIEITVPEAGFRAFTFTFG